MKIQEEAIYFYLGVVYWRERSCMLRKTCSLSDGQNIASQRRWRRVG